MAIVAGFTLQSFDSFFRDAQHDSRRLCGELKHNVVALAKAAKALKLPIVVTTTARDSMWGPTFPELVDALTGIEIIDRSSVNAFDDTRVARAIEATGRKKLIFAGISLEVCAAFPAITAVGKGFDAYAAVDASGTFSETKRQVGLLRMLQAGVIISDYATLMVEILKDNARVKLGPGKSSWEMLRDAPTTVVPVSRNRRVIKGPETSLCPCDENYLLFHERLKNCCNCHKIEGFPDSSMVEHSAVNFHTYR